MKRCDKPVRTLRLHLKDKHAEVLAEMARAVNMVWNYPNAPSMKMLERERRFIGSAELQHYLKGASKEGLAVDSAVFQQVADEYVTRRVQYRKRRLAWRKSKGARRSLGWIPFKKRSLVYRNGQIQFQGNMLTLWDSHGSTDYRLGAGSIAEDARGRWYLNVAVEVEQRPQSTGKADLGIDLGLKEFAAFSDELIENIEAQRFYRDLEPKLAVAQRANKKRRVKAIHAKIANRRKNFLHKLGTELVKGYGAPPVGNVGAPALAKTPMAKSVMDAGWGMFRIMLQYKGDDTGTWYDEPDEAYSTQDCNVRMARTGPKGLSGLGIREWTCASCDTVHHRDRNSAKNILAAGRRHLAVGILVLTAQAAARKG